MSDIDSSGWQISQPPDVSGRLDEIADGVFVIHDERVPLVPNVGVILGERSALVIDPGLGPANGETTRAAAAAVAGERALFVTTTHFHPEHASGVSAFAGVGKLVLNARQRDEMSDKGELYLAMFRGLGEVVAARLEGVQSVAADIVYDTAVDLDLGGRVVQLRSRGPAHTRGDQTILLAEEGILFCGDLAEERFFPIVPFFPPNDTDVDGRGWIDVLDELAATAPRIVVPGHGAVTDERALVDAREFLERVRLDTIALLREGHDPAAVIEELTPRLRALHPDWDNEEMIALAIGHFAAAAEH